MVEMGAPVVGDDPDRWAPPVGEREGEVEWAGGCGWAAGRRKKGREESGPRGPDGEGKGFGVWFFSNPFSQIILKTFKATQQQKSCILT
jgi:hypothetical protein